MPVHRIKLQWRGRIRALIRDTYGDLGSVLAYDLKHSTGSNPDPLFTPAQRTSVLATQALMLTLLRARVL